MDTIICVKVSHHFVVVIVVIAQHFAHHGKTTVACQQREKCQPSSFPEIVLFTIVPYRPYAGKCDMKLLVLQCVNIE